MAVVNWKGAERLALPTIMATPSSHAFRNGQPGMIREIATGLLTEPTANERERAMGLVTGTTAVRGIPEDSRRRMLGLAMDVNAMTWFIAMVIAYQRLTFTDGSLDELPQSFSIPPPPVATKPFYQATPLTVHPPPTTAVSDNTQAEYKSTFHEWVAAQQDMFLKEETAAHMSTTTPVIEDTTVVTQPAPYSDRDVRSLVHHFHTIVCHEQCTGECTALATRLRKRADRAARKESLAQQTSRPDSTSRAAALSATAEGSGTSE